MGSGQWWMIHLPCFRVNPGHHVSVRSGRYLPQQKCPVLWQATGRICLEISVGFCVGSAGHPNTSWRFGVLDPTGSMYGVFTFIYHKNQPNVGRYTSPMDPVGILVLQTSSQFRCLDVKVSRSHSWNFKVLLVVETYPFENMIVKNAGRLRIQLWGGVTPVSRENLSQIPTHFWPFIGASRHDGQVPRSKTLAGCLWRIRVSQHCLLWRKKQAVKPRKCFLPASVNSRIMCGSAKYFRTFTAMDSTLGTGMPTDNWNWGPACVGCTISARPPFFV